MLSDMSQIAIPVGLVGLRSDFFPIGSDWIRLELPDPVGFDLKIWPYHCHSDSKKFQSESTRIRPNPSGSAQIQWVTGKTSTQGIDRLWSVHDDGKEILCQKHGDK